MKTYGTNNQRQDDEPQKPPNQPKPAWPHVRKILLKQPPGIPGKGD
jgi:hypothetical protein